MRRLACAISAAFIKASCAAGVRLALLVLQQLRRVGEVVPPHSGAELLAHFFPKDEVVGFLPEERATGSLPAE